MLVYDKVHRFFVGCDVFAVGRFKDVRSYYHIFVDCVNDGDTLARVFVRQGEFRHIDAFFQRQFFVGQNGYRRLDFRRVDVFSDLFVKDYVRAFSRVNGKCSVARHIGDDVGINAGAVYDDRRVQSAAVGFYGGDFAVFDVHARNHRVQRDFRAVFKGVFHKGDAHFIRRREPARGHIQRARCPRRGVRLDFKQSFSVDVSDAGYFQPLGVKHKKAGEKLLPLFCDEQKMTEPFKRDVKVARKVGVHLISDVVILVFLRRRGIVYADVHRAAVS